MLRDLERHVGELAYLRECWESEGRPVLKTGNAEQPVVHPTPAMLRDLERDVGELASVLLLLPKARRAAQAGWTRGQPRAEDRQSRALRPVQGGKS
jgi:hypothetical protein